MGNVSLIYLHGNQNVVRAYIRGFTGQTGVTDMRIIGAVWQFKYPPADLLWDMVISPEFFPASSNVYSLDRVFDLDSSFSFQVGIPTPTSIYFGIEYVDGEFWPRLGTFPGVLGDPTNKADLPALANYWLPYSVP